ncbi:DUF4240 domain-containing protein [Streptomyces sp. DSM 41014]|uniref:DUF4240 domain-containing protein n=1 Tax=Streptomyces hintoniae TaxID=3075521 RepID=A0ABU2US11_9ACTN|nr:DUF4240 domain-containing protein [Streptomyces sp. DSM 41014]MDT0476066.1 DUF4240 domain-containing protein [Streptomyces sp. DSM 41014]
MAAGPEDRRHQQVAVVSMPAPFASPSAVVGGELLQEDGEIAVRREAFTWDLWAAAERTFGGWCSDDGFCCFGLWMVGIGWEAFARAVIDPVALADTSEVQCLVGRPRELWNDNWPEWESPDYVAMEAYELLTRADDDCGDAFHEAVEAEPRGEQWDVRCEDEAMRKLPKLSAIFPLRAAGPVGAKVL